MLASLIQTYGYVAIILGTFLEGETVLILSGFTAHRGYFPLSGVILAAWLGSSSGDILFFYLGRYHSAFLLSRLPRWQSRVKKTMDRLERHQAKLILMMRFLYGFRMITPFAMGMSAIPARRFLLLNLLSALLWATTGALAGYLFGSALEVMIGHLHQYEYAIMAAVSVIGILVWFLFGYRRGRRDL